MTDMIVKINGIPLDHFSYSDKLNKSIDQVKFKWKPKNEKIKKFSISLWILAGSLVGRTVSAATVGGAANSLWIEMQPVFAVFQNMAMILGALAILSGLIVMVFKKRLGWQIVSTSSLVILGCFLVPAAVMMVAIIGDMLNTSLTHVFNNFHHVDLTGVSANG